MKRVLLTALILYGSGAVYSYAGLVTGDEALASSASSQLTHADGFNGSTPYSTLPRESGGGSAKHYATSASNTTRTVTMDSTSTYNCALSGIEGDYRGWMEQGKVYESGGRWILYARSGGTTVVARAVCFPK
ncbi:hypothetical protein ACODM8_16025 [Vibrio ostreicida]|uniref:hypothetical protein n=1 Tax=Vibrio ostreicida TaxID=526588 RepID=UPI003B5A5359